jgi:hypothetical protein
MSKIDELWDKYKVEIETTFYPRDIMSEQNFKLAIQEALELQRKGCVEIVRGHIHPQHLESIVIKKILNADIDEVKG